METKWIEQIRVRSSDTGLKEAIPIFKKIVKEIRQSENVAHSFLMQHGLYDSDLAVVLIWKDIVKPVKTREGLLIAEQFRSLGQINHAVWVPIKD